MLGILSQLLLTAAEGRWLLVSDAVRIHAPPKFRSDIAGVPGLEWARQSRRSAYGNSEYERRKPGLPESCKIAHHCRTGKLLYTAFWSRAGFILFNIDSLSVLANEDNVNSQLPDEALGLTNEN